MKELWMHKYKPKDIFDFNLEEETQIFFKIAFESKNIPHMLLEGKSGIGKSSLVKILIEKLYENPEYQKQFVLQLNISEEKSIKMVRTKIKAFCSTLMSDNIHYSNDSITIPNFKLVVIDEAETMTTDSQYALRRIIEDYSIHTRFVLICNNLNTIIEPIISRCTIIHFKKLNVHYIKNLINHISQCENVKFDDKIIEQMIKIYDYDISIILCRLQLHCDYSHNNNQLFIKQSLSKLENKNNKDIVDIVETIICDNIDIMEILLYISLTFPFTCKIHQVMQNVMYRISNNSSLKCQLIYLYTALRIM